MGDDVIEHFLQRIVQSYPFPFRDLLALAGVSESTSAGRRVLPIL